MLPGIKKQCTAKAKSSGTRCLNPAKAPLSVCRLHGWNHGKAKKGIDHYNYQGKRESRPERAYRAAAFKEMKELAGILAKLDEQTA